MTRESCFYGNEVRAFNKGVTPLGKCAYLNQIQDKVIFLVNSFFKRARIVGSPNFLFEFFWYVYFDMDGIPHQHIFSRFSQTKYRIFVRFVHRALTSTLFRNSVVNSFEVVKFHVILQYMT